MSISIGSKKVSTPAATPEKKDDKPAVAKVLTLGGAKKPTAVEESAKEKEKTVAPEPAAPTATPAVEDKSKDSQADWDNEPETTTPSKPTPAATPAPAAPAAAPASTSTPAAAAASAPNFSRQAAQTDSDAIAKEAARVADADMLKELYGGEEADLSRKSRSERIWDGGR